MSITSSAQSLAELPSSLLQFPAKTSQEFRRKIRLRRYATQSLNYAKPQSVSWVNSTRGARLRVQMYGPQNAPTVVLSHGFSCSLEYWNPQINDLARDFRVIAYDQRGHGESTFGTPKKGMDYLGDDLAAVLDATLKPHEKAVLVGHSMGGITLQKWAKLYPEQMKNHAAALILANTTWGNIANETELIPFLSKFNNRPIWVGKILFGVPVPIPGGKLIEPLLKKALGNAPHSTDDTVAFVHNIVRSCQPKARCAAALELADLQMGPAGAAAITVPTVVIGGTKDTLLPEPATKRIAETLTETGFLESLVYFDTSHAGNIELPTEFNAIVRKTLATYLS